MTKLFFGKRTIQFFTYCFKTYKMLLYSISTNEGKKKKVIFEWVYLKSAERSINTYVYNFIQCNKLLLANKQTNKPKTKTKQKIRYTLQVTSSHLRNRFYSCWPNFVSLGCVYEIQKESTCWRERMPPRPN